MRTDRQTTLALIAGALTAPVAPATALARTLGQAFRKYLVGRDGHIAAVFATDIEPMDARVIDAIVKQLPSAE
jgi:glutathione peroxidase